LSNPGHADVCAINRSAMRAPLLPCLLLLFACGNGDEAPTDATGRTARDWSDDDMWAVLDAQDHRDRTALEGFLKDPRPEIRERAALAFASSPDSLALAALINALGDADPLVRKAVAVAIGNASDSVAWAALTKASDAEKDTSVLRVMLGQAFKAEVDLKLATDPERLFQLLGSGNTDVRTRAAQQLVRLPSDRMGALEENLLEAAGKEGDPSVRMFLVWALKHYRSDAVKTALMGWARSDSLSAIRVSALRALGAREDAGLQAFFLERTNDGIQAVRLTAVEQLDRIPKLDAQPIWEAAQNQGDPFTQLPLYGLVLKHGEEGQRLIARKLLEAQAALENMSYAEAGILRALAQERPEKRETQVADPTFRRLQEVMLTAALPVERSTALESAILWLEHAAARVAPSDGYVCWSCVYAHTCMDSLLTTAMGSGDIALIATAADKLAYGDSTLIHLVLDATTEQKARTALRVPRDLEAIIALDKAVAKRDGKPAPVYKAPPFNHPIDRTRLIALKDGQRYRIKTTKGDVVIALEPMTAPGTCVAFDSLVNAAFYNGKFFHRVIPNFVAQGGCPRGDGYGSMDWTLRTEIGYEGFSKGAVGIASTGRDTESCQFFIMTAPYPSLDGRYTRFAHVVEGQDVADVLSVGDLILAVQREGSDDQIMR
jgi:cyclophilin family peptidyl-prolyl cis-trans isomerase/HEAT repeat protein